MPVAFVAVISASFTASVTLNNANRSESFRRRWLCFDLGAEQPSNVVCGHEPSGEIVEIGNGCDSVQVGDRVVLYHIVGCGRCAACRQGYMLMCEEADMPSDHTKHFKAYGWQRDGGHAEYMLAEEQSCIKLPPFLTYSDGALIACGFGTAWEALSRVNPSGRDTLLITGVGPVGMAVGVLARAMGVPKIYGTDASQERLELAKAKGVIDVGFDVTKLTNQDIVTAIAEVEEQKDRLADLKGVSIAIDCSGVAAARYTALLCTKRWGRVVFVGEGGSVEFAVSPMLIHKQLTLHGSWVTSLPGMHDLVDFCVQHQLHPDGIVTHRFPLQQAHGKSTDVE
eukprot:m.265459 g.265459  ORF g.265459 m.265459 type:complete len:339 (-) comp17625_c0_seq45:2934-3950(-)